jgi:hypothetical protein
MGLSDNSAMQGKSSIDLFICSLTMLSVAQTT